jgi:hypothetical protein
MDHRASFCNGRTLAFPLLFKSLRQVNGAQIAINRASSPELPTMKTPTSHLSPIERGARRSRFRNRAIERGLPGRPHITARPLPMLGVGLKLPGWSPATHELSRGLRPPTNTRGLQPRPNPRRRRRPRGPLVRFFLRRPVFLRVFIFLFLAGIPILFPCDRAVVSFCLFSSPSSQFTLDEQQFRVIVATAHAVEWQGSLERWKTGEPVRVLVRG